MKSASLFEIVAARCWNVLNEGKTFTPVFVLSVFLLVKELGLTGVIGDPGFDYGAFLAAVLVQLPLFIIFYLFDYPLHLRWLLLPPLAAFPLAFGTWDTGLLLWALAGYVFFTVFFWGTLYYHLRIGTTWWNFTRIWKLFLINSDSTSGNALEQVLKVSLLLLTLNWSYGRFAAGGWQSWDSSVGSGSLSNGFLSWGSGGGDLSPAWAFALFSALLALYSWLLHRLLFTWKPKEYPDFTDVSGEAGPAAKRVVVIVIDGCRKEKFEEADAPFLHHLMKTGVYYDRMETVYPARTVVCFSSMFTGAYPREHGIRSNMVWRLGVRVESVFDKLREQGRKGILYGCAHLIDAFGDDVKSFTAVQKNDIVDRRIMEHAKTIMQAEKPDLMIIQMIAVDQTGHSRGVLYPEYLEKIKESDALIRDYYDWMGREGLRDNTVFVIMADHGQGNGIGGHGHLDTGERFVPFVMHGAGIRQGVRIKDHRSIVSLAPTISSLLGISVPGSSRGPILREAFEGKVSVLPEVTPRKDFA